MTSSNPVHERLAAIDWFAHVGEPITEALPILVRWIPTRREAEQNYARQEWSDTTLEARNDLTTHLQTNCKAKYNKWNTFSGPGRDFIEKSIAPKLQIAAAGFKKPEKLIANVKWNVLAAIMEHQYRDCNPPHFFTYLLRIYEMGHMPCGWEGGVRPSGRLLGY